MIWGQGSLVMRSSPCPILLLLGTESAEHPLRDATVALNTTLMDAHIAPLPGQGHTAHMMAPDLVAEVIRQFLSQ